MKKKEKKRLAIVLVIVILGFILFKGDLLPLTLFPLSISHVEVIDEGDRILVYAIQGGGQAIQIDFSPSNLNPHLRGWEATKTSILRAEFIESSKDFPFIPRETNVVKLLRSPIDIGWQFPYGCSISRCQGRGYPNTVASISSGVGGWNCACVEDYNNGYISAFDPGTGRGGFVIEFDLDGEKRTLTDASQQISFGDQATITWQGNLLGINEIGAPNYQVFHVGTSWYLAPSTAYSSVSNAYTNFKSNARIDDPLSEEEYQRIVSTYYNVVNFNIDYPTYNDEYIRSSENIDSISFERGVMHVNLGQPTFKPTYTIELDASRVGIIKLEGEPEILECIPDQVFEEAKSGTAEATIKNIGSEEGYFEFRITCDNPDMSGSADGLDFREGQTRDVSFFIYGGNPGKTTNKARCTLTVTDRNSGDSDSCNFRFDVEYKSGVSECIGDETKCSGDFKKLFTCVNGEWEETRCECEYVKNVAQCKGEPTKCVTNEDCDKGYECKEGVCVKIDVGECADCDAFVRSSVLGGFILEYKCEPKEFLGIPTQSNTLCVISWLKFSLVPIIFIFLTLFGINFFERTKQVQIKNKGARLLISLVIAGILAYLVFITFTLGIILSVIALFLYIILKAALGEVKRRVPFLR